MSAYHQPMPWDASQNQHQHVDVKQHQQPIAHGGPVVDDGFEVFIGRLPLTITKVIFYFFSEKQNFKDMTKSQFKFLISKI